MDFRSLQVSDQGHSYGRRAQATTYLPKDTQLALSASLFELSATAHEWIQAGIYRCLVIEGIAGAHKFGELLKLGDV
ncbi:MAG: hypothetical protein AAF959_24685 [Cyanobacteria bacterium P01_D01_bin.56]